MGKGRKILSLLAALLLGWMGAVSPVSAEVHVATQQLHQNAMAVQMDGLSQNCTDSFYSSSAKPSSSESSKSSHFQTCLVHCHLNQGEVSNQALEMPLLSELRRELESEFLLGQTIGPRLKPPKAV